VLTLHKSLELPVNVSDYIEVPNRVPVRIPNFGDTIYSALLDLQGKHIELTLFDPPFTFRGVVDNLLAPNTYIADKDGSSHVAVVQFRGSRTFGTGQSGGNFGIGVSTMGIGTLGVETES
jgi:hypothetical protein